MVRRSADNARGGSLIKPAAVRIAFVNQDPGIDPERHKGAAVHLRAMREAFAALGAETPACDESDDTQLRNRLLQLHKEAPIDFLYERYALGKSTAAAFAAEHGIAHVLETNAPLAEEIRHWRGTEADDASTREADRRAFAGATMVLAVSTPVADYAKARGARDETVVIVPEGATEFVEHPIQGAQIIGSTYEIVGFGAGNGVETRRELADASLDEFCFLFRDRANSRNIHRR